ncbi:MAG TPA: acetyl-CoA carboxylase biotin carboxyl carrier protein [Tepidisphaeraceae bacterium]
MSKKSAKKTGKNKSSVRSGSPMDVGLLEEMVRLMAANDLNTVDVRDGDRRVILKRGAVTSTATPFAIPHAAPAAHSAPAAATGSGAASQPAAADADLLTIKSPMVGTFYSSPSPDAKPFVIVGSTVDEESDVCIIEAMKVFNNIKAECRGTIAKILVTNGQTVEFGQALFLVKPA